MHQSWQIAVSCSGKQTETPQTDELIEGYVMYKKSPKWVKLNQQRLSISSSIADPKAIVSISISSAKAIVDTKNLEVKFSDFDGVAKFRVSDMKELQQWKDVIKSIYGKVIEKEDEFKAIDLKANVIKAGWMDKKKHDRPFSSKKKRYFILKPQQLFYLTAPPEPSTIPLGCFDLLHTQIVQTSQTTIELATVGRSYLLSVLPGETEPITVSFSFFPSSFFLFLFSFFCFFFCFLSSLSFILNILKIKISLFYIELKNYFK